jgi:glc operon protein GlcG
MRSVNPSSAALALVLLAATARAESPTVERVVLTIEGAKKAAAAAVAEARAHQDAGAIAIVDEGGNLLYLERLDGTFPAGANVSIGKARTAALFQKPTAAFEEIIKGGRTPMIALVDFTPLQGGVPIVVGNRVIGAIGVSGAASQQRDEAVAKAGAAALP